MSSAPPPPVNVRAGGFSHRGAKPFQEDRWASAEIRGGAVAAVADGMSDPTGRGQRGASAAVADAACAAFVDEATRALATPGSDPVRALTAAFQRAAHAAHAERAQSPGGAAFVGAYLADDGRVWTIKAGDCQAWGRFQGGWQGLTVGDDHDSTGALTRWLGMPPERLGAPPVTVREGCESVILGSDGLSRTLDEPSGDEAIPFDEARALCARAVQAGEPDNITAVVMRRSAPAPAARRGLLAALLLLAFSVGLFAAQMLSGPSTQVVLEPVDVVVPIPAQPTPTTAEVRL